MDDNFSTIINVAKWGRAVYINIQKFVQFQLTVNVVALMVNFVSACITGMPNLSFELFSMLSFRIFSVEISSSANVISLHLLLGSAPLTAVQLLWVNMIMDTLGALALATEPPNDEMMKRPPISKGQHFITRTMWKNIMGQSIYQLAVLGVLLFDGKQLLKLTGPDADAVLNTFIFNTFVFCQVTITIMDVFQFISGILEKHECSVFCFTKSILI